MSKLLNNLWLAVFLPMCLSAAANARVVNLTVAPRTPWNGKIDVTYSLECDVPNANVQLAFHAHDNDRNEDVAMLSLSGDGIGDALPPGGPYKTVWDSAADCPKGHSSDLAIDVTVTEVLVPQPVTGTYLMINLLDGSYTTSDTAPSLSDNTYRTTKLLLRRVPAGTFTMGSPAKEAGRKDDETQHRVTLTKDFYIGVFEMTQQQYQLIAGGNPSEHTGAARPVESVSYDDLRGETYAWPTNGHSVDAKSFFGKLRAKTGLPFDLPTEAQWEYACRAGSTGALNTGAKNLSPKLDNWDKDEVAGYTMDAGRHSFNLSDQKGGYSEHTKAGSYAANSWGLYDMHGNVAEWCLDSYGSFSSAAVTDPVGAAPNGCNVIRGGHWNGLNGIYYDLENTNVDNVDAQYCRSASRSYAPGLDRENYIGFRACLILP